MLLYQCKTHLKPANRQQTSRLDCATLSYATKHSNYVPYNQKKKKNSLRRFAGFGSFILPDKPKSDQTPLKPPTNQRLTHNVSKKRVKIEI